MSLRAKYNGDGEETSTFAVGCLFLIAIVWIGLMIYIPFARWATLAVVGIPLGIWTLGWITKKILGMR